PPKETTPAITRGKQRQQGAESDTPTDIPAAAVASPSEAPVVEKTIGQQLREIIDGQTTLMARVESLQHSHDEISTRIDRVEVASPRSSTPKPSSAAVPAAPETSSTSVAPETSASTSTGSDPSSHQSASSASRSGPTLPATMQDLLASMTPTDQSEFRSLLGKYNSSVTKLSAAGDSMPSIRPVALDALSDWEPTWREVSNTPLLIATSAAQTGTSVPSASPLTAPAPVRPPRSDLRTSPASTRPAVPSTSGDNRFDPSRVVEATATEKRGYRRNNGSIMRLNR
ncbi:unnamed protein product, partial [Tilletia caries]